MQAEVPPCGKTIIAPLLPDCLYVRNSYKLYNRVGHCHWEHVIVQFYALSGTISSFLDIRTCIRLFFWVGIKQTDPIPIEVEMLVVLTGGTSTFRDVLVMRMKDVEHGTKFAFLIEEPKIPRLNPATATTRFVYSRRRKP